MKNDVIKIAHRGSLSHAPENTLRAFRKAVATHVDMIELDVRICKTGEPIVMHDGTVDRTTNGKGKVSSLTLEEIKQLRVADGEPIPTLAEVLDALGKKVTLNIEVKTRQSATPVVKLLHKYIASKKITYDDVILASANILTLRKLYHLDKKFRLSVIVRYVPKLIAYLAYRLDPFSVQPVAKITTEKLVRQLQNRGIKVFPWALEADEDGKKFIKKMEKVGSDGIISFFPEEIEKVEGNSTSASN